MTSGFCRGLILLMESAPIPDQNNVSTDSGVTFQHPYDYSYQHYLPPHQPKSKIGLPTPPPPLSEKKKKMANPSSPLVR